MRPFCLSILFLLSAAAFCQDQVFLLTGKKIAGKVVEIGPENIILENGNDTTTLLRSDVLLIELRDGQVEILNEPPLNVVFSETAGESARLKGIKRKSAASNMVSLNTLALANADIAPFYEKILPGDRFGLGVMGAYNFNRLASFSNLFIAILPNGRKQYDLGAFVNHYPSGTLKRTAFFWGVMIKYTAFSFTEQRSDTIKLGGTSSVNVTYAPATGSQLATIFHCGLHRNIGKSLFLRFSGGLGGFNLKGKYKRQYNYTINSNLPAGQKPVDTGFLFKFYFSIQAGYRF